MTYYTQPAYNPNVGPQTYESTQTTTTTTHTPPNVYGPTIVGGPVYHSVPMQQPQPVAYQPPPMVQMAPQPRHTTVVVRGDNSRERRLERERDEERTCFLFALCAMCCLFSQR